MQEVARWKRFETEFISSMDYESPVQDVQIEIDFISPGGKKETVSGFWDGGKTWKVRFSPYQTGKWTYTSRCSREGDAGLNKKSGEFNCIPYTGDNPLYRYGAVTISENRRYLIYRDGTPFFWLSDTAWNGVLLSDKESWEIYLQDRASKGFTVVQFVTTQWRAAFGDADGKPAYIGKDRIRIDPGYYQRMDKRVDAMNDHGIVGALVLLWAISADTDPGMGLPDDQAILLARYMVARYGSHNVIWILAGDGNYKGERAVRWKKIGRSVFGDQPGRIATMHPCGLSWVADEFRYEPWFSFNGYQSGHGDNIDTLRWLCEGPPSQDWKKEPHHPEINLEPNYEAHNAYHSRKPFDARAIRRAAYWSLLVSPTAGVTYGAHGIWGWHLETGEPLNHKGTGFAPPWYEAIKLPGSTDMKHMINFFSSIEWWRLSPAPEMLADQPGIADPHKFIAVSKTDDSNFAVAYLAEGSAISLNTDALKHPVFARWFNPRTGEYSDIGKFNGTILSFTPADNDDWVLLINK